MMTLDIPSLVYSVAAVICAGLLSFTLTPAVRVLAFKINAIDTPKDARRMHDHPIPRIGGLAIFIAFVFSTLIFCDFSPTMLSLLIGGSVLVVLGVVDDVKALNPWIKLIVQIFVGFIPVIFGVKIDFITLFGGDPIGLEQYYLDIPITVLWVVGLTNAINLIDGLDGLACGVSAICCLSVCAVTLINGEWQFALITAILFGACIGFLPFNSNPAKIFMGDTGALFLGYAMAVLSVSGLFKVHAALSFLVPLSVFGLPLFDTFFAIVRRLIHGKSPFTADRGHLHHRLMDMGFGQKHSVRILYAICGILGIAAVMLSHPDLYRALIVLFAAVMIFFINFVIFRNSSLRAHTGFNDNAEENGQTKEEEKSEK